MGGVLEGVGETQLEGSGGRDEDGKKESTKSEPIK